MVNGTKRLRVSGYSFRVVLFASLAMPLLAHAQDNVCHNNGSSEDSYVCAKKAADAADEKLNTVYQQTLSQLTGDELLERAKAQLVESERAWIKFRDMDCEVQNDIFGGRWMGGARFEECVKTLTEQRTEELENISIK